MAAQTESSSHAARLCARDSALSTAAPGLVARFEVYGPLEARKLFQQANKGAHLRPRNPFADSGINLPLLEDVEFPPRAITQVNLGVVVLSVLELDGETTKIPLAFDMRPRSSMSKGERVLLLCNSPALIDAGYRGCIQARIYNPTDKAVRVERGVALLQVCAPGMPPVYAQYFSTTEAELAEIASSTERGSGGFGSTGNTADSAASGAEAPAEKPKRVPKAPKKK